VVNNVGKNLQDDEKPSAHPIEHYNSSLDVPEGGNPFFLEVCYFLQNVPAIDNKLKKVNEFLII
jgi:hypothetical protein